MDTIAAHILEPSFPSEPIPGYPPPYPAVRWISKARLKHLLARRAMGRLGGIVTRQNMAFLAFMVLPARDVIAGHGWIHRETGVYLLFVLGFLVAQTCTFYFGGRYEESRGLKILYGLMDKDYPGEWVPTEYRNDEEIAPRYGWVVKALQGVAMGMALRLLLVLLQGE